MDDQPAAVGAIDLFARRPAPDENSLASEPLERLAAALACRLGVSAQVGVERVMRDLAGSELARPADGVRCGSR